MTLQMPQPDRATLNRSEEIIAELKRIAGDESVIADEDGRRTFETDGLTAYRAMPLAVVLPDTTDVVAEYSAKP